MARKGPRKCGWCLTGHHHLHKRARPVWSKQLKGWWTCLCPEPACMEVTRWWTSRLPAGPNDKEFDHFGSPREWWQFPEEGAVICKPCQEGGDANAKKQWRKAKNRHAKCVDPLHCPCHHEVGPEGFINPEKVNK